MMQALERLNVFNPAHVPQWRALKLLTTDVEINNGDSEPQMERRTSSSEAWKRESWLLCY